MKPDCRMCIHHREIPGNTHVSCRHPMTEALFWKSDFAEMLVLTRSPVVTPVMIEAAANHGGKIIIGQEPDRLTVEAHPHGILRGWFAWPFNLDPRWLKWCSGFEAKDA